MKMGETIQRKEDNAVVGPFSFTKMETKGIFLVV